MSNNLSDKLLREKLADINPEFDPAAWEKMEKMLDKKKKRRGFIWWWTGGIAAGLLLTGIALFYTQQNSTNKITSSTYKIDETELTQSVQNGFSPTEHVSQSVPTGTESNTQITSANTASLNHVKVAESKLSKSNSAAIASNQTIKKPVAKRKQTNSTHPVVEEENTAFNTGTKVTEVESFAPIGVLNLEQLDGYALAFDDAKIEDSSFTSKKGSRATRKMVFSYSLGAGALVSAASSGNKEFYSRPSYMVGLTHDFLFVNRFAISNAVMFSKTSFQYKRPEATRFLRAPLSYTSTITEVAIPIGVKGYVVSTPQLKLYLSAGVVNHIKVKETFDYVTPIDTPTNIATTPTAGVTYPYMTDFTGYESSAVDASGNLIRTKSTSDFSLNKAKRYYASFYAGVGVEYIFKKRILFFAEPTFYMSLQKIGVQDKRKYNVGALGGIRYKF